MASTHSNQQTAHRPLLLMLAPLQPPHHMRRHGNRSPSSEATLLPSNAAISNSERMLLFRLRVEKVIAKCQRIAFCRNKVHIRRGGRRYSSGPSCRPCADISSVVLSTQVLCAMYADNISYKTTQLGPHNVIIMQGINKSLVHSQGRIA